MLSVVAHKMELSGLDLCCRLGPRVPGLPGMIPAGFWGYPVWILLAPGLSEAPGGPSPADSQLAQQEG